MPKPTLVTPEMRKKAIALLKERAANPAPPKPKNETQREFMKTIRAEIKAALNAGHSWESIVADLKSVGLNLSVPSAKQYVKPGKIKKAPKAATSGNTSASTDKKAETATAEKAPTDAAEPLAAAPEKVTASTKRGKGNSSFAMDDKDV